jgi:hypothetical protein
MNPMSDYSNEIIMDANNLKKNNIQKRNIKNNMVEILRKINDELAIAHKEGHHSIITSIPIIYNIPNMSNKDSQRYIWSSIIEVLESKNYRVWINPSADSCRLKITWMAIDDENEIKYHTKLLAAHSRQF